MHVFALVIQASGSTLFSLFSSAFGSKFCFLLFAIDQIRIGWQKRKLEGFWLKDSIVDADKIIRYQFTIAWMKIKKTHPNLKKRA